MVDHNHDRIEAVDQEKVYNEIHREILEGVGAFKGKGGDSGDSWMGEYLVHLAYHASGDKFPDVGSITSTGMVTTDTFVPIYPWGFFLSGTKAQHV